MRTGIVKFFSEEKGYGYITVDGGVGDVFTHISNVKDKIKERDKVSFEIEEEENRKKAINVMLI